MLLFGEHYPNAQIIFLSENFRSAKSIVEMAGKIICVNEKRLRKNITAERPNTGEFVIRSFETRDEEYHVMAEEIKRLSPDELEHCAVLFRNNSLCASFADTIFLIVLFFYYAQQSLG